jgi:hypothetical protein
MHSALHRFVDLSDRMDDFKSARQKADDMYDLFLNRHNMFIASSEDDHHNIRLSEDVESNMLLTESSWRQIMDGRFASTYSWTFELRFEVAMRSTGWPANTFLTFLQPCDSARLVTETDGQARTVLHWAAKHFGYWARSWGARDECPDNTMVESYAVLLKKFITMGADVHAVNSQCETPLMTALHQFMTFIDWPACALAIKRWGAILVEAGIVLSRYIQVENALLRSLAGKSQAWTSDLRYMLLPNETELLMVEDSILAAEIQFCRPIPVLERWSSPGAWDTESRLPTRSILYPPWRGERSLFWHVVETVRIYSEPYLIQGISRSDKPFYSHEDFENNWRTLFGGTQDDHGSVAGMILRDRSRSEAKTPSLRNRASSMPPTPTLKVYDKLPSHSICEVEVILGQHRWIPVIYKSPIEPLSSWRPGTLFRGGCWSKDDPRLLPNFDSRSVEERAYAEDDWEVELLREHGEEDVVKRFAQRFCPELRDQIEQELATTRLIMELE